MKSFSILLFVVLSLSIASCNDDDSISPNESNVQTNSWILNQMNMYYYWEEHLPTNTDLKNAPDAFFKSLLYTEEDRFSWIQNITDLENALNGISTSPGFEMKLYPISSTSQDIFGQVTYVAHGGPADFAGLKRGDLFTVVNGTTLTRENYSSLLFGQSSQLMRLGIVNSDFSPTKNITVVSKLFSENPIILDTVYPISNSKIGYFAYKNFIPDPGDNSSVYDNRVNDIFAKFKGEGINELILDFRFNTGGSEMSAQKLASLIVKGASSANLFAVHDYNAFLNSELAKEEENDYFNLYFSDEVNNVGSNLTRVIILTSGWTASASELIINGLRPYMNVLLVGETTYGKNVGSITLKDETKKITWGLQPIVVKIFNSNMESNYTFGFYPSFEVVDNDLELFPLGDINEKLLNYALSNVCGLKLPSNVVKLKNSRSFPAISNSLSRNVDAFTLNVDLKN